MSVNHVHVYVQCPKKLERPEGSFRSSETGDNRCFELPCMWVLRIEPGSVEEPTVPLTTKPSLLPHYKTVLRKIKVAFKLAL